MQRLSALNGWLPQSHALLNMSRRLAKTTISSGNQGPGDSGQAAALRHLMPLLTGLTDSEPLLAFATPPTQESADGLVQRIKADLHPGQLAFVDDQSTQIIGLSAGYGAGKTRSFVRQGFGPCYRQSRLCWLRYGANRPTDPRHLARTTLRHSLSSTTSRTPSGHHHCLNMFCTCQAATPKSFAAVLKIGHASLA